MRADTWTSRVAVVSVAAMWFTGCGLLAGVDFGEVSARGEGAGGGGGGATGATGSGGAQGSGGGGGDGGIPDGGGGDVAPPECDPRTEPGNGIFVSADEGDDAGAGTQLQPLKSIQAAIALAEASQKITLYLDEGTYLEAVTIPDTPSGVFVEGGWIKNGATWAKDCAEGVIGKTVIGSGAIAVTAEGVTQSSGLRLLTVATKGVGASPADESGESLVGVLVRDGLFSLEDVVVVAGKAGDGGTASQGAEGAEGVSPSSPGCACDMGGEGLPNQIDGAPALSSGTFSAAAYTPVDGSAGGTGGPGEHGTASTGAAQSHSHCAENGACKCDGGCWCNVTTNWVTMQGGPGRCGCAGQGGLGGAPGRGGGSAVALLVIGDSAIVSVERGALQAGDGGAGSPGGLGGVGGVGSAGAQGDATGCYNGCCGDCSGNPCQSSGDCGACDLWLLTGGAPGGKGGDGGQASPGGAGSGGPSYAVVTFGGASAVVDQASTQLVHGAAGLGPGAAADGSEAEILDVP